ncbi:MAG TPA: peptidylprolyl isomerase [Thermoanaerobaculaceae bacterium]|nr:peptidylprolyl isomerase [Thermoanaerobaculaceae bacterium]
MLSLRFAPLVTLLAASAALAGNPVLRVNGTELTDIDLKLASNLVNRQMQGLKADESIVLRHTVDQLIGRTLLLQAARDAKATADPKAVAASLDEQRKRAGGPEAFAKELAQLGITEQDLAKIEEESQVVRNYVDTHIIPAAAVTEPEAKTYFDSHPQEFQHPEQIKLRVLLVPLPPGADEKADAAAKARAEDARKRIVAGEDFAKVAQEVSSDPSKAHGGEVGWVRKGVLLPELEPAVWALKNGEVSAVLKTKYGYHIFKADDRRMPGPLPFDEVKQTLITYLRNSKINAGINAVIAERKAKAKIEALDPKVKAALESLQATPHPAPAGVTPAAPAPSTAAPTPKPLSDAPKTP